MTTYEVVVDPHSMFTGASTGVSTSRVSDGTATTLLVVGASSPVPWTKPEDLSLHALDRPLGVGSKHLDGFNAVMADGWARFFRLSGQRAIDPSYLKALATRDGHEVVSEP